MKADIAKMRYQLEVRRAEDRQLNHIIPDIRSLLDSTLEKETEERKWGMRSTGMSNLLGVCVETDSAEVVIGFIEYQMGRREGGRTWAWKGFGEALKEELYSLKEQAEAIVSRAADNAGLTLSETEHNWEVERVWMELIRLYAGHMRRYFVAKKGE
jgi:hypothetical protein